MQLSDVCRPCGFSQGLSISVSLYVSGLAELARLSVLKLHYYVELYKKVYTFRLL